MIKKITTLFILLSLFKVTAQKNIVFGLEKDYTKRHIRLNNDNPYVYTVGSKDIVIEKSTKVKKKSEEYELLKQKIADYEMMMGEVGVNHENDIEKYNSLNVAINNINDFVNSHNPIELSRETLIKSQEILDKFNIDELVYADNTVNSNKKTKFLILSSNHTELRLHLKEVVQHIESINTEPETPIDGSQLAELEVQLKEMKPYTIVEGKKRKITKSKLIVNTKVKNIPSELEGDFVVLDSYTMMLKDYNAEFKKGFLVKTDVANKKGLIAKGYAKKNSKKMIKNKRTNKTYIVGNSFLKTYAFTFNGKFRYQAKALMSSL